MKRMALFAVIACLLTCCVLSTGCKRNEINQEQETKTDETPDQIVDLTPLLIFDSEDVYYTIVRGTYADNVEIGAAVDLNAAIRENATGDWRPRITEDFVIGQKRDDVFELEGKEILIGITNRKESQDVHATLEKDQYVVKAVGEKIVVVGYDSYATAAAVGAFIDTFFSQAVNEKLEFARDFELRGESSLRKIAVNNKADYRIMTWNLGCMVSADNKGELECIDILLRYLPDIIGLQECNSEVHNKVLNNLPDFYAFANKKHNSGSTVNYTPIMYNTELFTLLKSDVVWLRGRYTGTNTKSLSWAVFEDSNGVTFALINYHGAVCSNKYKGFENFSPQQLSDQALEWKLDNVVQVIEIKNSIIAEFGNIPVMVSGDNNFNSSSQPYKNLTSDGFFDAEIVSRISKETGYKTSYSYGSIPGSGLSIDHIFGLGSVDFVVHGIVRGDDVWKASDHCPVFVDFNVTSK